LTKSLACHNISFMAAREAARSPAVEDYCKAIFTLESRAEEPVATNPLADRLGITPGSVSAMLKRLSELGLIEHHAYRGVRLTPEGRMVALEVIRHHRLIELFLAESLEMPWDRVHDEAEVLEHVLSEELEQLIASKLGNPTLDPHGDPIPSAELELDETATQPLELLGKGQSGVFVRVSDSDSEMLRYLSERGIAPGDRLTVRERQPFGGPLLVSFDEGRTEHAIGGRLATAMRVVVDRDGARGEREPVRRERIAGGAGAPAPAPGAENTEDAEDAAEGAGGGGRAQVSA
jgi:DtxR family transcriptional regulator, Mn-dependent transcriptional regulator